MFKIFYSWQSDLPSSKTKQFIKECIDDAIDLALDSKAIEAIRDEATKDVTGSPDIVSTLFSKINECDLFVADVTLCYKNVDGKEDKRGKKSPNPNVMLELGYAVNVLGWDRIVCLFNAEYGDEFPFDINHNRLTDYSLTGKSSKETEKAKISKIIFKNIRDLKGQAPRAKSGSASHILGTYDFEQKRVTN